MQQFMELYGSFPLPVQHTLNFFVAMGLMLGTCVAITLVLYGFARIAGEDVFVRYT